MRKPDTTMHDAMQALLDLAGGYCATADHIAAIAAAHDVETWRLEGVYFDALEAFEAAARRNP